MSAWEKQVLQSVSGIGEAYREPLLEIIRAYARSVKIGDSDVGRMDLQEPLSDKKKALMRMEELRAEFTFPTDFDPDRELEEARAAKYGSIG
ncbi:MAG: hypothetical protein NC124_11135 [Clostridium sp.]|nr:hypothetical protein [Clostridium sp.]